MIEPDTGGGWLASSQRELTGVAMRDTPGGRLALVLWVVVVW